MQHWEKSFNQLSHYKEHERAHKQDREAVCIQVLVKELYPDINLQAT